MIEFCADAFAERAAIMEFDGGLSRFEAETLAAMAQGLTRWQAMGVTKNAERVGNLGPARHNGAAVVRNGSDGMPEVQRAEAEQNGPMPVGDIQAGRDCLELLALRGERG